MILFELQSYIERHQTVSIPELVQRFDAAPSALEGMLDLLIRKGSVMEEEPACGKACSTLCKTKKRYTFKPL